MPLGPLDGGLDINLLLQPKILLTWALLYIGSAERRYFHAPNL